MAHILVEFEVPEVIADAIASEPQTRKNAEGAINAGLTGGTLAAFEEGFRELGIVLAGMFGTHKDGPKARILTEDNPI